jgi:hypothetical protein
MLDIQSITLTVKPCQRSKNVARRMLDAVSLWFWLLVNIAALLRMALRAKSEPLANQSSDCATYTVTCRLSCSSRLQISKSVDSVA